MKTPECLKCGAILAADARGGVCSACAPGSGVDSTIGHVPAERTRAKRPAQERPTVDAIRQALLDLDLLTVGDLDAQIAAAEGDVERLVRRLGRAGRLTPYQAGALMQGKSHGLLIGHYLILDKLGEGGMGVVFKARHRQTRQIVALKILPPSFGKEPDAVRRFRREFQIAAHLNHPNIVAAIEADEDRGVHFLTMDYIEGRDLETLVLQNGPLELKLALHCVIQAARGLEAAHAQGIIHRDVKPGNIMVDAGGNVRVLDLGLARVIEATSQLAQEAGGSLTQTGAYMGSVDFLAPEQADNAKRADHRADIYSLGCTLYFLLAGKPPFPGETILKRLMAHQERPAPSLRGVRPQVSHELEEVYQELMAKRPSARPQRMAEVIARLEACRSSPREAGDASADLKTFATRFMKQAAPRRTDRDPSVFARSRSTDGFQFDPDLNLEDLITDYREEGGHEPLTEEKLPALAPRPRPLPRPRRVRRRRLVSASAWFGLAAGLAIGGFVLWPRSEARPKKEEPAKPEAAVVDLQSASVVPVRPSVASWSHSAAGDVHGVRVGDQEIRFRWCPPGQFKMGSPPNEPNRGSDEDQVDVELTSGYWMMETEVTHGLWKAAGGPALDAASFGADDALPVYNVSYDEAVDFATRLTRLLQESKQMPARMAMALPTEAQWEAAARAGTTTRFSFGDDEAGLNDHAWHGGNAGGRVHPVGQKTPNAWGLFDMQGNVWEWCLGRYARSHTGGVDPEGPTEGDEHAVRGGSWTPEDGELCRVANRWGYAPSERHPFLGFRLVAVEYETPEIAAALVRDRGILQKIERPVSLRFTDAPFGDVLRALNADSPKLPIFVDPAALSASGRTMDSPVTVNVSNQPVRVALEQMLEPIGFSYVARDGLLTITSKAKAASADQEVGSTRGSAFGRVLYSDDFSDPTSGWPRSQQRPGAHDYLDGFYTIELFTGETYYWYSTLTTGGQPVAVEAVGRVIGTDPNRTGCWGVVVAVEGGQRRGFDVFLNRAGQLAVKYWDGQKADQFFGPIRHPAILPGDQLNKLELRLWRRKLELVVNGQRISTPVTFENDILPSSIRLIGWQPGPSTGTLAQVDRLEVRTLDPAEEP